MLTVTKKNYLSTRKGAKIFKSKLEDCGLTNEGQAFITEPDFVELVGRDAVKALYKDGRYEFQGFLFETSDDDIETAMYDAEENAFYDALAEYHLDDIIR